MDKEKEEIVLTEDEIADLKLTQHSMALEGHMVSMEEMLEIGLKRKAIGEDELIKEAVRRGKEEGIPLSEALDKYFFAKVDGKHE